MDGWMDKGYMDRWKDGYMNGCIDKWMDGYMDEWIPLYKHMSVFFSRYINTIEYISTMYHNIAMVSNCLGVFTELGEQCS